MEADFNVRYKEFRTSDLRLNIKGGLPKSMRDELDDHPEYYRSLTYKYFCDLLSTIEVKYERKIVAVQMKNIAYDRAASLSNRDETLRIPRKKKAKNGVFRSNKSPKRDHSRHHGIHCYCVLFKKAEIPERKYTSHSADN